MTRFDHIVVGAGIVGSCTALQLVKTGKKVLLLDQFALPHSRGSSHGSSRLTRSCYPEDFFAGLIPLAIEQWRELERSSGQKLLLTTGVLCIAEKGNVELTESRKKMLIYSPQHLEELTNDQLQERYPMLKFDSNYDAFLDRSGGAIYANKALFTVQELFKANGGELWDGCPVDSILPGNDVTVVTSRGNLTCGTVVVCAGAWTQKLLKQDLNIELPLQAAAVKVYYWKERVPGTYSDKAGAICFIDISTHPGCVYGLPTLEYPGLVKVTVHGSTPCHPDTRERATFPQEHEESLVQYIKDHLPGLESEPAIIENCMYTLTPDEVFIVDVIPGHKNIVVGTGFSGTGFKTSPIIGKLLSELATGQTPSFDVTPFSISRFTK